LSSATTAAASLTILPASALLCTVWRCRKTLTYSPALLSRGGLLT
jgi:hypothetical protein